MKKTTFFFLIVIGIAIFVTTYFASAIVGSYIINDPHIEDHLFFTEVPLDTSNISDVDKILYSFKISVYPYLSAFSLIFLVFITIHFIRTKNRENILH